MKFMIMHLQRHRNEMVFLKCLKSTCTYCMLNPPKAVKVYDVLEKRNMILFSPMPNREHLGHYCTFLEMCEKEETELTSLDDGMPSAENGIGSCSHCPAYVFLSATSSTTVSSKAIEDF